MTQWSEDVHARIAAAIRQTRGKRSAQQIADQTAALGHQITRAQIANYENGRKESLDIADFLVLSVAVGAPPVCLVYPGPYEDQVEVLPGSKVTQFVAAEWFSGITWYADVTGRTGLYEWNKSTEALRTNREIARLRMARNRALLEHLKAGSPAESGGDVAEAMTFYDDRIQALERSLNEAGDDA